MKRLIFILLSIFCIINCAAKSDYRLEPIEGQIVLFNIIYKETWPITTNAIIADGDSIEINSTDYNSIIESIFKTAKYTPVVYESVLSTAFDLMFKKDMNTKHSTYQNWFRTIDDSFDKANCIIEQIEGGYLEMRFYNIQAIAMITTKDVISGFYSEGIEYNQIPELVYIPIYIVNAEKTNDLKVKFLK